MENKLVIIVEENGGYTIETKFPGVVVVGMIELIKQTEISRMLDLGVVDVVEETEVTDGTEV